MLYCSLSVYDKNKQLYLLAAVWHTLHALSSTKLDYLSSDFKLFRCAEVTIHLSFVMKHLQSRIDFDWKNEHQQIPPARLLEAITGKGSVWIVVIYLPDRRFSTHPCKAVIRNSNIGASMIWHGAIWLGDVGDLVIHFEVQIYNANNNENWQYWYDDHAIVQFPLIRCGRGASWHYSANG